MGSVGVLLPDGKPGAVLLVVAVKDASTVGSEADPGAASACAAAGGGAPPEQWPPQVAAQPKAGGSPVFCPAAAAAAAVAAIAAAAATLPLREPSAGTECERCPRAEPAFCPSLVPRPGLRLWSAARGGLTNLLPESGLMPVSGLKVLLPAPGGGGAGAAVGATSGTASIASWRGAAFIQWPRLPRISHSILPLSS